jgi:hypothetical protein
MRTENHRQAPGGFRERGNTKPAHPFASYCIPSFQHISPLEALSTHFTASNDKGKMGLGRGSGAFWRGDRSAKNLFTTACFWCCLTNNYSWWAPKNRRLFSRGSKFLPWSRPAFFSPPPTRPSGHALPARQAKHVKSIAHAPGNQAAMGVWAPESRDFPGSPFVSALVPNLTILDPVLEV